jgi:hypothetical protein
MDRQFLQKLLKEESSQEIELVDMGKLEEEEQKFLIVDKDTGDVYDMRNQDHIQFLNNQITTT